MKISIIGFGRFGRLLAQLLKEHHGSRLEIAVTSRTHYAAEAAALDVAWQRLEDSATADVVVLCVPIRELDPTLTRLSPLLRPGTLVMDTCSVKVHPSELMCAKLPSEVDILATHPMFGPDSVRELGIKGRSLVSCPLRIGAQRLALVEGWFQAMGVEILRLTPEEHDRQAAISQGLVHFIGRAVERAGFVNPAVTTANAGRLFELAASVTADSLNLFYDLEHYNPFATAVRERFLGAAASIEEELKRG